MEFINQLKHSEIAVLNDALQKAGIVIYGLNAAAKPAFVVPYSEGRFGYDHKYYALPIGTIDSDESPQEAAARETKEETGIGILKLIGAEAYQAFLQGREVSMPIESPGYPGVKILAVHPEPALHTYISRANTKKRCALYGIEVEGIEQLMDALKNPENSEAKLRKDGVEREAHTVCKSVREMVSDRNTYPQLEDFVEWLRTGEIPDRFAHLWKDKGQEKPQSLYSESPASSKPLFVRLEEKYKNIHVLKPGDWKRFCNRFTRDEDRLMGEYFAKIKEQVRALGIIQDDMSCLKLDDKDSPMHFFQEGAEIITAEEYAAQCQLRLAANKDYDLAFGGAAQKSSSSKKERNSPPGEKASPKKESASPKNMFVHYTQIGAMGPFIPREVMDKYFGEDRNIFDHPDRMRVTPTSVVSGVQSAELGMNTTSSANTYHIEVGGKNFWSSSSSVKSSSNPNATYIG